MGSINQNHVFRRRELNLRQRAQSMSLHRRMSSLRDSETLGRSEQCCESTFLRNSAGVTADLGASACHPSNCRHSCQSNFNYRTSAHFHHRVPVDDVHAEGSPRVVNRGVASVPFRSDPRGSTQSACNCGGHGPEESEVQVMEENRCYHRGATLEDSQAGHGHSHTVDDCRNCCLSRPITHVGRDEGGYSFDDRLRGTGRSPCFPVSEDFTHRVTANGFMAKPSPMSRKATTIASRTDSASVANVLVPTQASKEQVIFYGWFLKRPTVIGTPVCSTLPQIVIGGYKNAGLLDRDYCESGPIVQRLERWRLRTSDGVEVGLMGMIDVAKSVENGFPIVLAQCFMIGFPSSWIYMISNLCTVAPNSCNTDLPSSSASPSNADGQTQDTRGYGRKVPLTTEPLEADPVHIILSSALFTSPESTRVRSLRRLCSMNNASVHSGVVSDATSVPQSVNSQEDLEKPRNDSDSCYGAINSGNHSAWYEPKVPVFSESPVTESTHPEGGGEHPASLGHSLSDEGSPAVPKEELSKERGVAALNTPETSLTEQAHNIVCGEFLVDGNSRGQEEEARIRACEAVSILQDIGGVVEAISKECTCASNSDLKLTFPSSTGEVGLDVGGVLEGDNHDRENKAGVHVKDSSNEEPSNRGDKIAEQCALDSKGTSDSSRKRPFQELNPEEEANRQSKVICGTSPLSGVSAMSTGEGTSGILQDPLPAERPGAGLIHDSMPCTPFQESKKRPRIGTETPCVDQDMRGEGVCNYNADEPILDTVDAEQCKEDEILVVLAAAQDLTAAGPKDCKRLKKSASPAILSGQTHDSGEESIGVGVELILETSTDACADEITVATKDLVVNKTRSREKLTKVKGNVVPCGQLKPLAEEYSEAEPMDDASIDVQNEQSTISPKNLNIRPGATRRSRRRVAVVPPSSQSGKESKPAPGAAAVDVACLDGVGKESHTALNLYRELEEVTEAERLCKGEAKDILTTPRRKYHKKPKVRYYKGRRRRYFRRDSFAEDFLDPNLNPDCKSTGEGKCPKNKTDDWSENSKKENTAVDRQKQQRATRSYYKMRRRKSHSKDDQTLGDGPGDAADSKPRRDPEECETVTKLSKRWRKTADRCSSPASKLPLKRRAPVKASNQGVGESKSQKRRMKLRSSIVPPPPPPPRVVDKTMVPEAFGLKKSRHGRVLVPRLASWLNQSIKYDMDGSIIAISEGFQGGKEEFGTGCCSFKPPSDKDALSMQRKLLKAAELV